MHSFLTIGFIVTLFFTFLQFARQEYIQEFYEEAVLDVEGRLDWAKSRRTFPFGMRAQIDVSAELLGNAKYLWRKRKWDKAYQAALQSQEAMDKAQRIYSSVIISSQRSGIDRQR